MRHFPLTKTDWRSERLKGGSESELEQQGRTRESGRERAWNCSRSAWPSFDGTAAAAVRMELPLAWRRGGKGARGTRARLAMGHRASEGSSAGAGGVESTRGLVLPCHSPRRQMGLLGGRTHKSPSSHPAHIKYGSANIHHVATWLFALGVALVV